MIPRTGGRIPRGWGGFVPHKVDQSFACQVSVLSSMYVALYIFLFQNGTQIDTAESSRVSGLFTTQITLRRRYKFIHSHLCELYDMPIHSGYVLDKSL